MNAQTVMEKIRSGELVLEPDQGTVFEAKDGKIMSMLLLGAGGASAITIEATIGDYTDDIWWGGGGAINGQVQLLFGNNSGNSLGSAMLFKSTGIPQGATIQSAKITFTGNGLTGNNTCNLRIVCEDADGRSVQETTEAGLNGLVETTSVVDWPSVPAFSDAVQYDTPDLTSIIQEVVNRAGFNGNINVMVEDNSSSTNASRSVRGRSSGSTVGIPVLSVTYK